MTVADVGVLCDAAAASCSADGSTRLWDLNSGEQVGVLRHSVGASFVARLNDAEGVTVLADGNVCFWSHKDRVVSRELQSRVGRPAGLAVSRDGLMVYLVAGDGAMVAIRAADGELTEVHAEAVDRGWRAVAGVALSTGEDALTFGCRRPDGVAIQVVVGTDGRVLAECNLGDSPSHCAAWIDHENLAVGVDDGRVVKLRWAESELRVTSERALHRDIVWTLHYARATSELITGSSDGTLVRSGIAALDGRRTLTGLTRGVWSTAWHPDGARLLSAAGDGTVALWDVRSSERLAHAQLAGGWIRCVCWVSEAQALVVAQKGVVYEVDSALKTTRVLTLKVVGNVWSASYDAVRGRLGFGTDRGEVGVLDVATGALEVTRVRERLVSAVSWTEHGALVAGTATGEGFVITAPDDGPLESVLIAALDTDDEITAILAVHGDRVVVGFWSGLIALIEGRAVGTREIGRHDGPVQTLAATPDPDVVVSCGADGAINRWSVGDRRAISHHSVSVSTAGLSVIGDRVACGSGGVWVFGLRGSSESPGSESLSLADPPLGLVDTPVVTDAIGRRQLAHELAFLCQRTGNELERRRQSSEFEERGFLLHIGGAWGSGKTSLAQMVVDELASTADATQWSSALYNTWQGGEGGPLVDLLTAMDRSSAAAQRPWMRLLGGMRQFWTRRPGLVRSSIQIILLVVVAVIAARFLISLVIKPSGAAHKAVSINSDLLSTLIAIGAGVLGVVSFVAGRTRPILVGVHARERDDEGARIRAYEAAVIRHLPKRLVVVVDELDRCDASRVLEVLRACHQLMIVRPDARRRFFRKRAGEEPCIAVLLLSDREWLCNGIEASYASQTAGWDSKTKRLGSAFMEKLSLLSFDLPSLSPRARAALVASATGGEPGLGSTDNEDVMFTAVTMGARAHDPPTIRPSVAPVAAPEEGRFARSERDAPPVAVRTASGALMPTISSTADPRNIELVERAAEIERRMRIEHRYVAQYARLIGATPREIKRVLVRYWIDRVAARSEGRDVVRFADAILFESIVTVRWPNLALAVRERRPTGVAAMLKQLGGEPDEDLETLMAALDIAWRAEREASAMISIDTTP